MQPYKYDSTSAKGKEAAVSRDQYSSQHPSSFGNRTMAQSQIPADTVERPEATTPMNKAAFEDAESSQLQRQRRLRMSKTWSSSSADINLISKEEEVLDVRPFVMEYNQLAKKVGTILLRRVWTLENWL